MGLKHGPAPKETIFSVGSTGLGVQPLFTLGWQGLIDEKAFPFSYIYMFHFMVYSMQRKTHTSNSPVLVDFAQCS